MTTKEKALSMITELESRVNLAFALERQYIEEGKVEQANLKNERGRAFMSAEFLIANTFDITFNEQLEAQMKAEQYN